MTVSLRYLLGITLVSGGVAGIGVSALNSNSKKLDIVDKNDSPNRVSESDRPSRPKVPKEKNVNPCDSPGILAIIDGCNGRVNWTFSSSSKQKVASTYETLEVNK